MQVTEPITEDRPLAYATPDGRFVIAVQNTGHSFAVTVENAAGFRVDELSRTHATESEARDLARDISKRLRDGATVAEVVAAIQPAAELINAVTAHLALAEVARKLTQPQRDAILGAVDGWIRRGNGVSVSTLYALDGKFGDLTRTDGRRKQVTGLRLNDYGLKIRRYLTDTRTTIAA